MKAFSVAAIIGVALSRPEEIHLRSTTVSTANDGITPALRKVVGQPAPKALGDSVHVIATLENKQTKERLQSTISSPLVFIQEGVYSFMVPRQSVAKVAEEDGVEWLGHFDPTYKFPEILAVPEPAQHFGDSLTFTVVVAEHSVDRTAVAEHINSMFSEAGLAARVMPQTARQWLLLVDNCCDVEAAVEMTASIEVVTWVEPQTAKRISNNDASRIVQGGALDSLELYPIHNKGLTGEGIVVGVSDSGSDYKNCLLSDETQDPSFCESACTARDLFADPSCYDRMLEDPEVQCQPTNNFQGCSFDQSDCIMPETGGHRKEPIYWSFADRLDDLETGHGTHTTGSVGGAVANATAAGDTAAYAGGAPGARLVFMDMAPNEIAGMLLTPPDFYDNYFPFFTQAGANVISQSWGSMWYCQANGTPYPFYSYKMTTEDIYAAGDAVSASYIQCGVYDQTAHDIDRYVYDVEETLVVFAAGNDGTNGWWTQGNEASSKNSLSIGASRTSYEHLVGPVPQYQVVDAIALICNPEEYDITICSYILSSYGRDCEEFRTTYCDMFTNDPATCCTADADWIAFDEAIGGGLNCCMDQIIANTELENQFGVADEHTVAVFSSRGPVTDDYRIKPELLAPGDIILSAKSNPEFDGHYCEAAPNMADSAVKSMSGTSMACPHAAAGAALVQQYYQEGFASCGEKCEDQGFVPTAALIKATMINSATSLMGHAYFDGYTGEVVDMNPQQGHQFINGFGLINLNKALGFLTEDGSMYPVLSANTGTFVGQDEYREFIFTLDEGNAFFSATLVWSDPAASITARNKLVNDLDLDVILPDCTQRFGNAYLDLHRASSNFPAAYDEAYRIRNGRFIDRVNNAERIYLDGPQAGTYRVRVSSYFLNSDSQSWSLVVNYERNAPEALNATCVGPVFITDTTELSRVTVSMELLPECSIEPTQFVNDLAAVLSIDPVRIDGAQEVTVNGTRSIQLSVVDVELSSRNQDRFTPDRRQPQAISLVYDQIQAMYVQGTSVFFQPGAAETFACLKLDGLFVTSYEDMPTGGSQDYTMYYIAGGVVAALVLVGSIFYCRNAKQRSASLQAQAGATLLSDPAAEY
jgi:subtilisin family serine protease